MKIKKIIKQIAVFLCCSAFPVVPLFADQLHDAYAVNTNKNLYAQAAIKDIITIPQDSRALTSNFSNKGKTSFVEYYAAYFKPWDAGVDFDRTALQNLLYKRPRRLAENYAVIPEPFFTTLENNANLAALDTLKLKAIIIQNTHLRILPTNSYLFGDVNEPGEGYPFDYAQDDFLRIGEPILISHYTKDGVFAYVKTSSGANGFVLSQDLVAVDAKYIAAYRKNLIMLSNDSLANLNQHATVQLYLGTILPIINNKIFIPGRNAEGKADLLAIKLAEKNYIAKPLTFSKANVAKMVDTLVGQPYGWGGNLFHMDCARLVRNYFAVFGVHMPLLSKEQAKHGVAIDVTSMQDAAKKQALLTKAIPYQSIIYLPGHICLYLGEYKGEPIMLHAAWGLKLFDADKVEYRYVIGKSIISTLSPGKELHGYVAEKSNLLRKVTVIANFNYHP